MDYSVYESNVFSSRTRQTGAVLNVAVDCV